STTIGMLVMGSIINPRIFISTSIMPPNFRVATLQPARDSASGGVPPAPEARGSAASGPRRGSRPKIVLSDHPMTRFLSSHHLSHQAVGKTLGDQHINITSSGRARFRRGKIQRDVLRRAADHLSAGLVLPFHHHLQHAADLLLVVRALDLALAVLQNL